MYVFGGGGRHHSEFGWELEVRVLRKEVLWSERGGCLSGKRAVRRMEWILEGKTRS